MNLSKIALASVVAAGLTLSGTAQAASTRAGASLPVAGSTVAKKAKLSRSAAPSTAASNEFTTTGYVLLGLGIIAAGVGIYEATKGDDSPGN